MIVFDDTQPVDQKVAVYEHKAGIVDGQPVLDKAIGKFQNLQPTEPLKNECLSFLNAMHDGREIYTDGEEGLRVLEVLSRADDAMKRGS